MCRFEGICGLIICVNNNWAASRFVFSPDICGRLGSKHQLTCWSGRSRFVTLWWCVTVKQGWFDGEFSGQPVYCEAPTQKKKKKNEQGQTTQFECEKKKKRAFMLLCTDGLNSTLYWWKWDQTKKRWPFQCMQYQNSRWIFFACYGYFELGHRHPMTAKSTTDWGLSLASCSG